MIKKIMRIRTLVPICIFLAFVLTGKSATNIVLETDLNKYFFDGSQLTKNWEVRYLNADPVDVSVQGRSRSEAVALVDGNRPKDGKNIATSLSWKSGQKVEIVLDLKQRHLISAIYLNLTGNADWKAETSLDSMNWWAIPAESLLRTPGQLIIPSLARLAQFVRLTAVPGEKNLSVQELFVYGEKADQPSVIGGVYPSVFPPVAGQSIVLRAILRNMTSQPMNNVAVEFFVKKTGEQKIGECLVKSIEPGASAMSSVPWTPSVTDPHDILVRIKGATKSAIIPVVNRKLYFGSFRDADYDRLRYNNLYTRVGDTPQYWLIKLHGGTALAFVMGPHAGDMDQKKFEDAWLTGIEAPFRDGIALDEWTIPYTNACKALENVAVKKGGKMVFLWLNGPYNEAYRHADLLGREMYCNMHGHNLYRSSIGGSIRKCREVGLLDKTIMSLGYFCGGYGKTTYAGYSSTAEEIEREVRFIRAQAPEMPGLSVWGATYRPDLDRLWDKLWYDYFIAPVIIVKEVKILGSTVEVKLSNIGGMNARNVKIAAFSPEGKTVSSQSIALIFAGQTTSLNLEIQGGISNPDVKLISGEGYTVLESKTLDVIPSRQVKGNPIQIGWTDDGSKLNDSDTIEFVNRGTGKADLVLTNLNKLGKSDGNGNFYVKEMGTDGLSFGDYLVRLVNGETREIISAGLSITPAGGQFSVKSVNGKPWSGDAHAIEVKAGDTFEVSWDLKGCGIESPEIYISAPGDPLRAPGPDKGYAYADIAAMMLRLIKNPEGNPMEQGSWVWKTKLSAEDFIDHPQGWIWDARVKASQGGDGAKDAKVNMSLQSGEWKLWIGSWHKIGWAVPKTPVITVLVR